MRSRTVLFAALADAACILLFAAVGRASHGEGNALVGVLQVAWPFLAGCAVAWVPSQTWREPLRLWPHAVGLWALTWGWGMFLRHLTGAGTAPSFLVVAAVVLAVLLIGWRGVVAGISAARRAAASRRETPSPQAAPR
ncbi:DUF3054 domain-containing protein [Pengzhenrongella sp.]|jgi:hypothetical protein|uniref:DUF3054 domain-containing protein n=1 Tax=Pengzhenrongella sp. TaxID=2888820 RepID=UPI002F93BF7D